MSKDKVEGPESLDLMQFTQRRNGLSDDVVLSGARLIISKTLGLECGEESCSCI